MMRLDLAALLVFCHSFSAAQVGLRDSCTEAWLYHDLSLRVVVNGAHAIADISVKKWTSCHRVKSIYVDQRERDLSFKCYATNSSKHFVCYELPLDLGFNIVVAVNVSGEYVNKTVGHLFTTDVQSVFVEPSMTTASVTCHLATGNECLGCHVQWRDADEEGEEEMTVAYKMSQNSLTASTIIGPLVPGHTYILAACDVESDRSLSGVKLEHLFETKFEGAGKLMLIVTVSVISPVIFLCICILFSVFLVRCCGSKGQVARSIIKKFKYTWRKNKTPQSSEDQDVEDTLPPPPIPPRTTDMFIPATVSSTSTAGTESTTTDDVIVTDILMDVGTTNTPTNAHCHTITFRAMNENFTSEDFGSAPPIPPHTNEMYLLKDNSSKWGTTCAEYIPCSDDQRRDCFILEGHVAEKGSNTESMLAQNEDTKTEVDRDVEYPDDTISETSCDIGFPPPIPRRTQDMFLIQSFDPNNQMHTTDQIEMVPNTSYTKAPRATL